MLLYFLLCEECLCSVPEYLPFLSIQAFVVLINSPVFFTPVQSVFVRAPAVPLLNHTWTNTLIGQIHKTDQLISIGSFRQVLLM